MFAFLKRTLLVIVGFLLIATFIWFAGPYFAFADYRPLEPVTARLVLIGVVVGIWLLMALIRRLRAFRASGKLMAAVVAQKQPESARPSPEAAKLRERFEEAVGTLQQQRSGTSLYDLPWYVIIGAPGSGKTTALLNSGLKFPLEQRVGKGALRGVGGTRNCDWWFTDEAVFLDTAGRYTTQDSDAASDSAGWAEFLALLRKYRGRRPINGVILTINAHDLMTQGGAAREAQVEAARRRLTELNRELHIQLPVYVLVTKCDLVAGFTEHFDDLPQEGRAQVWGVTFPYEQTVGGAATQALPQEFDALIERLNAQVFGRVEEIRDVRRRARTFGFPQQMAALRDLLVSSVTEVFTTTRFEQQVLLRGVYFTSGTQEGTPVDRLLGSIGRRFGVGSEAVSPSSGPGKAYFVERLLKEVMIGESGLAGVNRRGEARKAAAQLGAYAAMALFTVVGIAALTISYGRNRTYLAQAAGDVAALQQVPPVPPTSTLDAIVPRLDAVRAVVDSADRYHDGVPWAMRWGLYQGGAVSDSARDAYLRELDGLLLPRVTRQIRSRVIQSGAEPDKLYVYLKAYLMLGDSKHLVKTYLQNIANNEWNRQSTGAALTRHFQALLDYEPTLRPMPLDASVISQARNSIRQVTIAKILYESIKASRADDPRALRLSDLAGVGADRVFRRESGVSLSTPLPALYTKAVFKEIAGQGQLDLLKALNADQWVFSSGGAGASLVSSPKDLAAVMSLYEADYIKNWDEVLNDLRFVQFSTVPETNEALRILIGATSPLRGLVSLVVDNTTLVEAPKPGDASGVLAGVRKKVSEGLENVIKPLQEAVGTPTGSPGALVTAHFQGMRLLNTGEDGKRPIDGILKAIADIQQQLSTVGPDVAGQKPIEILSSPKFRELMMALEQQSAALPDGLRILVKGIVVDTGKGIRDDAAREIIQKYEQRVVPECRRLVENHYPFGDGRLKEITLAEFGQVFGYGGVFEVFVTDNVLDKQVDMSGPRWAMLPGGPGLPQTMLDRLQAAQRVRDMFFVKGSMMPALTFVVTLGNMDASAKRFILQIDGKNGEATPGPAKAYEFKWPGMTSAAVATFEERYLDPPTYTYSGSWAWFRLVDATRQPSTDPGRTELLIKNNFHRAQVLIQGSAVSSDPFLNTDWRMFGCGI